MQIDVDRWLTEEGRKVGGHLPWGGGPRMCLGFNFAQLEIKVGVLTCNVMHTNLKLSR